ncbi:outer membrane beta-barrel family protein [Agriterribacter sp.]|uniref:outer membrane beta-barrel family protein n=1 Tax=Agriterribacter sp. TaxID=2821509 RepID=UPI002B5E45D3|nr:outer membrane beta-barrel family protein [Agriterribacter sp.]HTN06082.1 outer membrane beta-barrel family protein [Agriterribacter sp.]
MKCIIPLLVFIVISLEANAQDPEQQPTGDHQPTLQVRSNRIYGKLVDENSGKGIEAASVQLYLAHKDSLYEGMLTKSNGNFSFSNISTAYGYKLIISALGYEPFEQIIAASPGENGRFEKDLGNIALHPAIKQLADITITATRPALEMNIDRKVFNVDKSLTATGGTAVDVMKNIPSVSVDIDGNVELRNSTPQIFVDGRPTILTLDQIPADHIEKVELITNPSAKFDASTSGGIINVVLKKEKRFGLNGIVSTSVGVPRVLNGNLSLNLRQGKLNFFMSGGYNQSGGKAKGKTLRENKPGGVTKDYFNQYSVNTRFRKFSSINFGFDYFMDNRNTFSITQRFGGGNSKSDEVQEQEYLNSSKVLAYYGNRVGDSRWGFNRNSTRASYKHTFPQEGRELTADITYNYGKGSSNSTILNRYFYPDGSIYKPSATVNNDGRNNNNQVTFEANYLHPIGENAKFETGLRAYFNDYKSYFNVFGYDNGQETKLPLSNNYKYTENINAVYGTYSQKMGTFSFQAGLRAEYSKFDGLLIDNAFKFGYQYPKSLSNIWNALFPSLFLTQRIGEDDEVQVNFSRRIRRPNFWQLNPYIEINDPVNLRQGNPQLQPEFINSFEFNYSKGFKGGNLLGVLYWRNNPNDITQYSDTITAAQYEQLQNAAVDPNAILNTWVNASTTNRYGAEFTLQYKAGTNFDITPSINLQYRKVNARINDIDLSNKGFNWDARLTANYKIKTDKKPVFNNLAFQVMGNYESPRVIPQGKMLSEFSVDFAIRKDLLKNNRGTITFGINDVFNTRRWGTIYDTENFYQDAYRRWNVRNFRLSFSYKFGKADFSLLNRNNRGGGGDED